MQLLDGEREWLTQVVTNPCNDVLKLVYADWLQENGDEDRAHFLRSFVEASQSMDPAAFPVLDRVNEEWPELLGYYLLKAAADRGLPHAKEPLLKLARPAITFITDSTSDTLPVGASKVGGLPDLPPGFAWPTANDCHTLTPNTTFEETEVRLAGFVAQINLADLAGMQAARDLPSAGVLSFFAFLDQDIGSDAWFADEIGVKCLYFPNTGELVPTEPPDDLEGPNTTVIEADPHFFESFQLPEPFGPWEEDYDDIGPADYHALVSELRMAMVDNSVLGYALTVDGNDPTPAKEWRHLLLVRRDEELMFEFQIPQADLLARNFDAVRLTTFEVQ